VALPPSNWATSHNKGPPFQTRFIQYEVERLEREQRQIDEQAARLEKEIRVVMKEGGEEKDVIEGDSNPRSIELR